MRNVLARAHGLLEAHRSEPARVLRVSWTAAEELRHLVPEVGVQKYRRHAR